MPIESEIDPREPWNKVSEFVQVGITERRVSSFTFQGPLDVPTHYKTFVGIFPFINPKQESGFAIVSEVPSAADKLYQKILNLKMTDRLNKLTKSLPTNPNIVQALELRSAIQGEPSIVLGLGVALHNNEEVITLFTVAGSKPEDALQQLQQRTRVRIAKLKDK